MFLFLSISFLKNLSFSLSLTTSLLRNHRFSSHFPITSPPPPPPRNNNNNNHPPHTHGNREKQSNRARAVCCDITRSLDPPNPIVTNPRMCASVCAPARPRIHLSLSFSLFLLFSFRAALRLRAGDVGERRNDGSRW